MSTSRKAEILVILISLGILFIFLQLPYDNQSLNKGTNFKIVNENYDFKFDENKLKISKLSTIIHIDNNWTAAKSAGICTGNGTYSDPYVIEDFEIDGGGSESCIWIENSDVYFRIENCSLYNSGGSTNAGILLSYVTNAQILNSNFTSNYNGIYLFVCDDNEIAGNMLINNDYGINLIISDNNIITGNSINNNHEWGLHLYDDSDNNEITSNTITYNNKSGIILNQLCYFNNISSNIVTNNQKNGIYLNRSYYNEISDNNISNNIENGLYLLFSYNNKILVNILNNNDNGIFLLNGDNNEFSDNTINHNENGIYVSKGHNNDIIGNLVWHNNYSGIHLNSSLNGLVYRNTINDSKYGVYVNYSFANTLYFNNFLNNNQHLFSVFSSNIWNSSNQMVYTYNNSENTSFIGNYWDTYIGNDANKDGIGDNPFLIEGITDSYPLIQPIENYENIRIYEPPESSPGGIPGYNIIILIGIISGITIFRIKRLKRS